MHQKFTPRVFQSSAFENSCFRNNFLDTIFFETWRFSKKTRINGKIFLPFRVLDSLTTSEIKLYYYHQKITDYVLRISFEFHFWYFQKNHSEITSVYLKNFLNFLYLLYFCSSPLRLTVEIKDVYLRPPK